MKVINFMIIFKYIFNHDKKIIIIKRETIIIIIISQLFNIDFNSLFRIENLYDSSFILNELLSIE